MRDVPRDSPTFRSAVELARTQWGVISVAQLRAMGAADGAAREWLRAGRLIRLHRGVYAVGHDALRREGRWFAAVLACGAGAALSYATAATHLGLRGWAPALIDVSVAAQRRSQPGIHVHRPRSLDGDVAIVGGIPTTTATRTIIDLAGTLSLAALESLAAEAEHRGLIDHARLSQARSRKLRTIFAGDTPPARTRSRDETRFLAAIRAAGLPEPESNVWLTHGAGEEWQPDHLFRQERVIVEIDDDRHRTRRAFELDRAKDATRQADGYATLRFTRRQLRKDPARAVSLVAATLSARRSVG
ncbi:MAG: type IV toxin-antitoxin system AbiEi family antitoxin domain-containing protein [Solirubrobacteraceae bacterium]